MYGPEYLDWTSEEAAGRRVDEFLASMEAEDRKWVLAVLRKRFEVRVEYRDRLGEALLQSQLNQQAQMNMRPQPSHGGLGSIMGSLGRVW